LMADGTTKPISDIEVGDLVVATDPETGEEGPQEVLAVWAHDDLLYSLTLADGSEVTTTEDHPFWNATDQQWQQAQQLDPGDQLLTVGGRVATVGDFHWLTVHSSEAYNLTVANTH